MNKMRHFSFILLVLCSFITSLFANITTSTHQSVQTSLRNKGRSRITMQIEAIYQFGDSLSDTGNLVRETTRVKPAFARLPYGQTFFHRPTGRCSDGLLMVDYFVAGATALDASVLAAQNISGPVTENSLRIQLQWFRSLLHTTFSNPREIKRKLENALVLMGEIGGNDYNLAFFQGKTLEQVYQLVPNVVQTIKYAVQEVIWLGATNIVVPGNFPIGCVPLYLVRFETNDKSKYDELQCLKDYNDFSKYHNELLIRAIQELQQEHPNVAIVYGDYYYALTWVIKHAPRLGFERGGSTKVCCAIGNNPYNYDLKKSCGSPGVPICEDPSKRISWDGIHMTQEGNKNVAIWLLKNSLPTLRTHFHP
ncbi:GDSL esterase/lipase At5g03980-like isoform X2 [Amaranthus tricolor]|uniref:GDSL esterase/lipase At5g03980-like isoform X2 n=1 Tax=Amaranthus tricolor TaxID=29722 RepID=UPI0025897D26|nr:GDSL esterase/lipase At5g03980-like isoform X2 [Amaranthus tricolor]